MDSIQTSKSLTFKQCNTNHCSIDSSIICVTHRSQICNVCASIFHYDCDLKIKNGERFILEGIQTISRLIDIISEEGIRHREFSEEIKHLRNKSTKLNSMITNNFINVSNVECYVEKTKSLIKEIIMSHVIVYQSKLKISRQISDKQDDESELGLYNIRTQFYLNAKKKEQEFCEGRLKALALEISANVERVKQKADQRYMRIKERLSQQFQSTEDKFEELKQVMMQMFMQLQQEYKHKLEGINQKIGILDCECKELSSEFNKTNDKMNKIKAKQGIMNKDQSNAIKNINKKLLNQTKEIEKSIKKFKTKVKDISKRINNEK